MFLLILLPLLSTSLSCFTPFFYKNPILGVSYHGGPVGDLDENSLNPESKFGHNELLGYVKFIRASSTINPWLHLYFVLINFKTSLANLGSFSWSTIRAVPVNIFSLFMLNETFGLCLIF
jgi:hypothetical protein